MNYYSTNNKVFTLFLMVMLMSACTKRIDLELEEDKKRTAINTRLVAQKSDFKVKVTKSGNYLGDNSITNITNAFVTLVDSNGTYILTHKGQGEYVYPNFSAVSDREYRLMVTENGKTHEAKGRIPHKVSIDSITYFFESSDGLSEEGYVASITFQDPANVPNYYKVELLLNGVQPQDTKGTFTLIDDKFMDGNTIEYPVLGGLKLSDTLVVNLFSIDKATYTYYEQLAMAIEGDGAAPSNPDNNFGKNTLGHFSLMAISTDSVIIN